MSRSGDSTIHFEKLKPMQFAEIKSVMDKRLPGKFTAGLSPEAQEAMQQALEETTIQEVAKKGKRGSKGNVIFKDTVQVRQEIAASNSRRSSCSDIFEDAELDSIYTSHIGELLTGDLDGAISSRRPQGLRRGSLSKWVQRRASLPRNNSGTVDEVEEVVSANRVA